MVVHVADLAAEQAYIEDHDPATVEAVELGGVRTFLSVPMLKENELIGTFSLARQEVRAFTDKQIALVTNFAAQAVIAIENARLLNELRQSLEQQTATSQVLQVISSSPGELEPVFATMLEKAVSICDAGFGNIYRVEGDGLRNVATHNTPAAFVEALRSSPYFRPRPKNPVRRMMETKAVVHVVDNATTEAYAEREPIAVASIELGDTRTLMVVPMLKDDNELVGAFTLARQEVHPFTDKQIALVQNFAAQAVIAIENARLLNELRQRTDDLSQRTTDLTEALEQQTATSEVLRVVSSSPADLTPVFEAMLDNAVRICDVMGGSICRWDGNALHHVAVRWINPAFTELLLRTPIHPNPKTNVGRMLATKKEVHVPDLAAQPAYIEQREPGIVAAVEIGRVRTALYVPMLREDELVGAILLARGEVRPFTNKQIELLQNFGAQAVIAIENARLLNELRQSLEQQTATGQVLQVISRSTGELAQVFSTILANAPRICEAKFGTLYLKEGDGFRATATHNAPPAYEEARTQAVHPSPHTTLWQAANTKRPVQIVDVTLEQGYSEGDPFVLSAVKLGGYRSALSVPLLQEDEIVGVISIFRREVSSFSDEHVLLLQNFAAQAVIAIENARLLSDLQGRTKELSALNEQLEQRVADQVGEIERTSRLRRFLPPQVADLIVASGSEKQLESHRQEITALFCDLRGFTGFSESSDPEDVMALLRDYHAAIGEIIIKYSGTLERFAGDGVMVVFNDPVPVENSALQAVLMALEMRAAIGRLTEQWRRLGHDIGFGIGIAHGFATLGTIGFEGRFDYAAIGTVSNVASRLCDEAKPGQILISPRVLMKIENAVKVVPVGEFELKGIRRPLAAYNVLSIA
jgi:GAF domain-containing protein